MKIVKRVLTALGLLSIVFIVLAVWIGVSSARFRKEERPFVVAFTQDLSRRWQFDDVYARLDNQFIQQADTSAGQLSLAQFRRLGSLQSVDDFEMNNYLFNFTGPIGVFSFKGTFANGHAVIRVTLVERNGAARVLGLNISGVKTTAGADLHNL